MVKRNINILFVSAECTPFAKIGGLADVIGSLPKALEIHKNINIEICLPLYKHLVYLKKNTHYFGQIMTSKHEGVSIYKTKLPNSNVIVYLFYNKKWLSNGEIYLNPHTHSSDSNQGRFAFFNLAVLEFIKKYKSKTNIVHCHDWHTGFLPFLIRQNSKIKHIKSVFTIHNIANQGNWVKSNAKKIKLPYPKSDGLYINFIETGIKYADYITTVSPSYAKEILTKQYGYNLAPLLKLRKTKLVGILNGIDIQEFNPATDKNIFFNFTKEKIISKNKNKKHLQTTFNLPKKSKHFLIGVVTRLFEQKGMDWLAEIIPNLSKMNVQIILLGTGDKLLEKKFKLLEKNYPKTLRAHIDFNIKLAQQIYASCDAFLVPSRFEPCGLTQMIAMRYGTVPIVRETGGLKDSVIPYKKDKKTIYGTGFIFTNENSAALLQGIESALKIYHNKNIWKQLQKNCMQQNFSWETSAKKYIILYKKLTS
jgi:starch synthase